MEILYQPMGIVVSDGSTLTEKIEFDTQDQEKLDPPSNLSLI